MLKNLILSWGSEDGTAEIRQRWVFILPFPFCLLAESEIKKMNISQISCGL